MTFIVGLLTGLAIWGVCSYVRRRGIKPPWYGWTLAMLGALLVLLSLEVTIGSVAEREPRAALVSLLFLGAPGILLFLLAWRLSLGRRPKEPLTPPENEEGVSPP